MQINYLTPNEELLDALTKASELKPVEKKSHMKNFVKYPKLEQIPQTTKPQKTSIQPGPITVITSTAHWKTCDFSAWAEQTSQSGNITTFTGKINGGWANCNGYSLQIPDSANWTWQRNYVEGSTANQLTVNCLGTQYSMNSSTAQDLVTIYIYLRYTFSRLGGAPFAATIVTSLTKATTADYFPLATITLNKNSWLAEITNFGNVKPIYFTSRIYPA